MRPETTLRAMSKAPAPDDPRPWFIGAWALLLFLIWSNSFIAIGLLLGSEEQAARFDPLSLTVARFVPLLLIVVPIILIVWPREAWRVLRAHWRRLLVCGFLAVPGYSLALYAGQAGGVPPPIASIETSLAPLFLMILSAAFLGERLSRQKLAGFAVAVVGLVLIARAKDDGGSVGYAGYVVLTALAPLAWAIYSVLTKPITKTCHPVLWTFLALVVGTLPLVPLVPFSGGPEMLALDGLGWGALLYLALLCTVFGNAAWNWLVKHMPASSVGFTIFLNPPLTTTSKALLATFFPAIFVFQILPLEWIGGAIVLLGLALALWPRPPKLLTATPPVGD